MTMWQACTKPDGVVLRERAARRYTSFVRALEAISQGGAVKAHAVQLLVGAVLAVVDT